MSQPDAYGSACFQRRIMHSQHLCMHVSARPHALSDEAPPGNHVCRAGQEHPDTSQLHLRRIWQSTPVVGPIICDTRLSSFTCMKGQLCVQGWGGEQEILDQLQRGVSSKTHD